MPPAPGMLRGTIVGSPECGAPYGAAITAAEVIVVAGRSADQHADLLAAIKVADRIGLCG